MENRYLCDVQVILVQESTASAVLDSTARSALFSL